MLAPDIEATLDCTFEIYAPSMRSSMAPDRLCGQSIDREAVK